MNVHIPHFETTRVLVVGDVMLDRYWHGDTARISPEAPVPVVKVEAREDRPGGAANVALNVAGLGACPLVIGVTGNDQHARELTELLTAVGARNDFLKIADSATITKLRVVSQHQQLIRLDFEDGFPQLDHGRLNELVAGHVADHEVVIFSDYGKGALGQVEALIACAREAGKPALVDPKGRDFGRYRGATLLTPNRKELEAVVGRCADHAELLNRGNWLLVDLELQALLITRGEEGMTLLERGHEPLHLPTHAREVYDVTGAGDTVISTLAVGLGAGMGLVDATQLANVAAGVVVGKLGTAGVRVGELRRAMFVQENMFRGVVNESQLMDLVEASRALGERVVMTNGCFDILHAGHVTYLEQARRLGDRLLVAVNDDDSVRRLKGESRPVNSQEQRMEVLAGLGAVDWVVAFTEDTPERLICKVCPDFLVKGGDNDPERIPGNQCVWDAGGEVVVMDYVDGRSTTGIIARIQKRTGG
jgi:D-beta-D-heptose 7-phosphate kinase/D-beta-D-heptose 1-phosphate adenosyltransferase